MLPFQSLPQAETEQADLPWGNPLCESMPQAIGVRGAVICCKGNIRAEGG